MEHRPQTSLTKLNTDYGPKSNKGGKSAEKTIYLFLFAFMHYLSKALSGTFSFEGRAEVKLGSRSEEIFQEPRSSEKNFSGPEGGPGDAPPPPPPKKMLKFVDISNLH